MFYTYFDIVDLSLIGYLDVEVINPIQLVLFRKFTKY